LTLRWLRTSSSAGRPLRPAPPSLRKGRQEPPSADPLARWCGSREGNPPGDPIGLGCHRLKPVRSSGSRQTMAVAATATHHEVSRCRDTGQAVIAVKRDSASSNSTVTTNTWNSASPSVTASPGIKRSIPTQAVKTAGNQPFLIANLIVSFPDARCSSNDPYRQAGPVVSDCELRRNPGLAWSRMVMPLASSSHTLTRR